MFPTVQQDVAEAGAQVTQPAATAIPEAVPLVQSASPQSSVPVAPEPGQQAPSPSLVGTAGSATLSPLSSARQEVSTIQARMQQAVADQDRT